MIFISRDDDKVEGGGRVYGGKSEGGGRVQVRHDGGVRHGVHGGRAYPSCGACRPSPCLSSSSFPPWGRDEGRGRDERGRGWHCCGPCT